jgi:hypothetical protein
VYLVRNMLHLAAHFPGGADMDPFYGGVLIGGSGSNAGLGMTS